MAAKAGRWQASFRMTPKRLLAIFGWMAWVPLATYTLVLAFGCYALFHHGSWPAYGRPDPGDLPNQPLTRIASLAAWLGLVTVAAAPLGGLVPFLCERGRLEAALRRICWSLFAYAFGATIWISEFVNWINHTGGLLHWLAD